MRLLYALLATIGKATLVGLRIHATGLVAEHHPATGQEIGPSLRSVMWNVNPPNISCIDFHGMLADT